MANKGISLLKFLAKYVNRETLGTLYKLHVRPHLDYGDVIYHDQLNESSNLLESVQYNAALVVSGCWKGTNKLKLYSELGWESLYNRRHCRRLCLFYKILHGIVPSYLNYDAQHVRASPTHRYLKSFYPYCITHWFTLPNYLRKATNFPNFKQHIFHIYRPQKSLTYKISDNKGLKLITRLRCDFSDLRDHRFRHSFNCLSPLCSCGDANESTTHFLLNCQNHSRFRLLLFTNLFNIGNVDRTRWSDSALVSLLLYGHPKFSNAQNHNILSETISFINKTERFKTIEAYSTEI